MNTEHPHDDPRAAEGARADDADLAALLQAAGPRDQPSAAMTAEVRAAVAAEWRAVVAARQPAPRRRLPSWVAVAASGTAIAIALGLALPRLGGGTGSVATVARLEGAVEVRPAGASGWQPLAASAAVSESDSIRTLASGRIALRRDDGLEVRLDGATQLAFAGDGNATLASGRVYVDAGRPGSGSGEFVLRTPLGDVRHLGTQYAAGLGDGSLQVAVREGSVAVDRGPAPVVARAGETLRIADDGAVERASVAVYGDAWRWAEAVAPPFAIDGRSLDEFLAWAGRETGREVVYVTAEAAREAERTRLKGSIAGLSPEAAVTAVLSSEPQLQHAIRDGQIRIEPARR